MITGFRVARGGAQQLYGVEPDLTVLGKVIGGGLPAAAFAGPRELMERMAPAGDVYQAGTLSGNPLAIAAGLATLRELDAAAYARLAELTDRLAAGLARLAAGPPAAGRHGPRPAHPLLQRRARSATSPPRRPATSTPTPASAAPCSTAGVYPPPSQFEAWFVSLAHDEETIDRTLEAAAESLDEAAGADVERRPSRRTRCCALAAQLREEDTPISPHVVEPAEEPALGLLAAAGPSAAAAPGEYALVVEAVREGYLLHYGEPRLLAGHDDDLALLAGDYLYALGLERLAALGDAAAVAVLAELIGRCAQLHAEGREDEAPELWHAAALAIGGEGHGDRQADPPVGPSQ